MLDTRTEIGGHRLLRGERLDRRYKVVDLIGEGAVGEVYEAWDEETGRPVALKTLRTEVARHPAIVERFRREVQFARMAPHKNVCRTFHLGTHPLSGGRELIFVTMERLTGMTLARYLDRKRRLTVDEALPLVVQMIAGLQAVHDAGIIYRDLRPGNLMLVPDAVTHSPRVVLTDLGLARRREIAEEAITSPAQVLGTPPYMAPEQVTSGVAPLTPATDIYALGTVLYEVVTSETPFAASSRGITGLEDMNQGPVPPRRIVADLDRRWEAVIMRCLERLPERRFQTARDVEAALTGEGLGSDVRPS